MIPVLVSFPSAGTKYPTYRRRGLIRLTVTEDSVHGWLAPRKKQYGKRAMVEESCKLMAAGKQREQEEAPEGDTLSKILPLVTQVFHPGPTS